MQGYWTVPSVGRRAQVLRWVLVASLLLTGCASRAGGAALTASTSPGSVTVEKITPEVDGLTDIGWRLTGVIRDGAVTEVPAGTGAGIVLHDGMLILDTGPLGGRSPFRFSEDRLFLGSLSLGGTSYQADVPGPVDDVMPPVLLATPSVLVEGDQLTLTSPDGAQALRFVQDAAVLEAMVNPQPLASTTGGPGPTATTGS